MATKTTDHIHTRTQKTIKAAIEAFVAQLIDQGQMQNAERINLKRNEISIVVFEKLIYEYRITQRKGRGI